MRWCDLLLVAAICNDGAQWRCRTIRLRPGGRSRLKQTNRRSGIVHHPDFDLLALHLAPAELAKCLARAAALHGHVGEHFIHVDLADLQPGETCFASERAEYVARTDLFLAA